jgi:hypothetical protein
VLYVAVYFALSTPEQFTFTMTTLDGSMIHSLQPKYRVQNQSVERALAPLQWLDKQIRPGYWCWADVPASSLNHSGSFSHSGGTQYSAGFGGSVGRDPSGGGSDGSTPEERVQVDLETMKPLPIQWSR